MNSILEKYSINHSVEALSKEIVAFSVPKFVWWWNIGRFAERKKGMRKTKDFCEIFEIIPKFRDPQFNVIKLNLKLVFLVSKDNNDNILSSSGYCFTFENKNDPNIIPATGKLAPRETSRGLEAGLEVRIFIPKNWNRDKDREFKYLNFVEEEIYEVATHELTHLFQSYKITSKGHRYEDYEVSLSVMDTLYKMREYGLDELAKLLYLVYISLTKSERAAYLAQLQAKRGDFWMEYLKWFRERSFKAILKLLRTEMTKNGYTEKRFMRALKRAANENSADFPFESFEEFIEWAYDVVNRHKNYLLKKAYKIGYQIKQEEEDERKFNSDDI